MLIERSQTQTAFHTHKHLREIIAESDELEEFTWGINSQVLSVEEAIEFSEEASNRTRSKKKRSDPYVQTLAALEGVYSSLEALSSNNKTQLLDEQTLLSLDFVVHTAESLNKKLDTFFHTKNPFAWSDFFDGILGSKQKKEPSILRRLEKVKANLASKIEEIKKQRAKYYYLQYCECNEAKWLTVGECSHINIFELHDFFESDEIREIAFKTRNIIDRVAIYLNQLHYCGGRRDLRNVFRKTLKTHFKRFDDEDELAYNSAAASHMAELKNELLLIKSLTNVNQSKNLASACAETFKI